MAAPDANIYRASVEAPVNIAVIKYACSPVPPMARSLPPS
jgi:hypothetical protein